MKLPSIVTNVVAAALGVLFLIFGLNFFLQFLPIPPAPEGSPAAQFLGAMYVSGLLALVKVLEIIGGVLVAVPATRRIGLLVLGPVIANIVLFQIYFTGGAGLTAAPVVLMILASFYLLYAERAAFGRFFAGSAAER
jgi:putative oxidoreductase